MLLWFFVRVGFEGREGYDFFVSLSFEIIRRGVNDFDVDDFSMLVWVFVKRCLDVLEIFDVIEEEFYLRGFVEFGN